MDWIKAFMAAAQTASSLSDMFDKSGDESISSFIDDITKVGDVEKSYGEKYGSYADMFINPTSWWMQNLNRQTLNFANKYADKQITKLRSQGIYSPAMESLIEKESFAQAGTDFYSNVDKFLNVATDYSRMEQEGISDWADTMVGAYTTKFTGEATQPGLSEGFSNLVTDLKEGSRGYDDVSKLFGDIFNSDVS